VAGPCGNFTRFPILLLPEKRQQAPEAKTVLSRRRLIYTERCVMEMLRRGVYENCSIIARFGHCQLTMRPRLGKRKHSGDEENQSRSITDQFLQECFPQRPADKADRVFRRDSCLHSCRRATMGSTLLAWRAGKMQASSAASRSTNETAPKTIGSIAPTP
jgi:hypothetical protein